MTDSTIIKLFIVGLSHWFRHPSTTSNSSSSDSFLHSAFVVKSYISMVCYIMWLHPCFIPNQLVEAQAEDYSSTKLRHGASKWREI